MAISFKSEKELCNFIDNNPKEFAEQILKIDYLSHNREFYLGDPGEFERNKGMRPHVDFMFTAQSGENILVECKFPLSPFAALNSAIGQMLAYFCIARKFNITVSRLCIVSTETHNVYEELIREFNLPIEFYLFQNEEALIVPAVSLLGINV